MAKMTTPLEQRAREYCIREHGNQNPTDMLYYGDLVLFALSERERILKELDTFDPLRHQCNLPEYIRKVINEEPNETKA